MRASTIIPFAIVIGIGVFEIADRYQRDASVDPPALRLIGLYGDGSRVTVRYMDLEGEPQLAIPIYLENTSETEASGVVVELEYPEYANEFIVPSSETVIRQADSGTVYVHEYETARKRGATALIHVVDESQLSENDREPVRVRYQIRCNEVADAFDGVLTVYLKPSESAALRANDNRTRIP